MLIGFSLFFSEEEVIYVMRFFSSFFSSYYIAWFSDRHCIHCQLHLRNDFTPYMKHKLEVLCLQKLSTFCLCVLVHITVLEIYNIRSQDASGFIVTVSVYFCSKSRADTLSWQHDPLSACIVGPEVSSAVGVYLCSQSKNNPGDQDKALTILEKVEVAPSLLLCQVISFSFSRSLSLPPSLPLPLSLALTV